MFELIITEIRKEITKFRKKFSLDFIATWVERITNSVALVHEWLKGTLTHRLGDFSIDSIKSLKLQVFTFFMQCIDWTTPSIIEWKLFWLIQMNFHYSNIDMHRICSLPWLWHISVLLSFGTGYWALHIFFLMFIFNCPSQVSILR